MLYYLFEYLSKHFDLAGAGLFRYITFRALAATLLSLFISVGLGERIIKRLQRLQVGETVRDLGLDGQKAKQGTPTMGGIIIILSILLPCLLFAKIDNVYVLLMMLSTLWMGAIGFMDDYIKVFKKDKEGLRAKYKIIGQVGLGLIVALVMLFNKNVAVRVTPADAKLNNYKEVGRVREADGRGGERTMLYVKTTTTNVPFMKDNELDYANIVRPIFGDKAVWAVWLVFIFVVIFIVTAVSNAANLTDGIDGLAAGTSGVIGGTLAIFAYLSGNTVFSDYLHILYIPDSGELVIFASCFVGACIGFLWYNTYPAQVFMGDTGSLTLGGIIAALAIVLRKELIIPVLCGVFLAENLSVIIQVSYFKYSKRKYGAGRRIFLMSPLHHHFQKLGMHESKIVMRFIIVGIVLAVLSIITLKIR